MFLNFPLRSLLLQTNNFALSFYQFYYKAYSELGDIYTRQKRYDLAIAMYEKVLAIDPENSDALRALKFLRR